MNGLNAKRYQLSAALLASTLLIIPNIGFADTAYPPDAAVTQNTSATGNIDVAPTGKIDVAAGDAVNVDSASAIILVEPNNVNNVFGAINSQNQDAIEITAAGTGTTIILNEGSLIRGNLNAINVGAAGALISINGTLMADNKHGVNILAGGTTASVFVDTKGYITAGESAIRISGDGATINNNGKLASVLDDTIAIFNNFNVINNTATGNILQARAGYAGISVRTPVTGNINNSGLILHDGTGLAGAGYGIEILGNLGGTITNTAAGTIRSVSTGAGAGVRINANFTAINNAGVIEGLTNGVFNNHGILSDNVFHTGTITNTGIIRSQGDSAIKLGNGLTEFINAGQISTSSNQPTFLVSDGSFTNGVTNTGIIINNGVGPAIDFQLADDVLFNQNGGTVTGNVFLGGLTAHNKTAMNMTGGTVEGYIYSSLQNNFASTVNFSGGTVDGQFLFLYAAPAAIPNVFNLSGTNFIGVGQIIGSNGSDTFNITGGTFVLLSGQAGANNITNINASYTLPTTAIIHDMSNLNIAKSGTVFNVLGEIDFVTNTLINPNTSLVSNSALTVDLGNATNNGTVSIVSNVLETNTNFTNNAYLNIHADARLNTNTFNQFAPGAYAMEIKSSVNYGVIQATGAVALNAGSTINPYLTPGGFIPDNDFFYVIGAPAGQITDFSDLVQPQSALVTFTKSVVTGPPCAGSCLELRSHLNSMSNSFPLSDVAQQVANTLDPLFLGGGVLDPDIEFLFGELERLPSYVELNAALEQLAPSFNYSMVAISHIAMDNAFDSVQARLEELKGLGPIAQEEGYQLRRDVLYNGVNYGDNDGIYQRRSPYGGWAKLYGTYYDQLKRNQIEGYKGESTGYAVGADWMPNDYVIVGAAGSYAKVNSTDNTMQRNTIDVESYQATFYGTYQATPNIYFDSMVGIATHEYYMQRNINIGALSMNAIGQPYSFQYGGQVDIGYAFTSDQEFIVSPLTRFKYTRLTIGNYTEIGAGGLNLRVENTPIEEQIFGAGLRVAWRRDFVEALYVPEAAVMLLYDFAGDAQQMQSQFLGGGAPFYVTSVNPAQYIQVYSFGITAYTNDGYDFSVKMNLEHRDHFFGYNGYMQLKYIWG